MAMFGASRATPSVWLRKVGVASEAELKAIEAAALLHDMGKLAIPEHILNKPGKLTEAEFETMKRHADIGADILSAIDFPYPVVPIVRYHHENWDGHGYPDGLTGEEIPLGARILAVVDCFDALTSDRPYRPRLPDSEALQILRDRAGNMYDPALVGTFTRIYREIAPPEAILGEDIGTGLPVKEIPAKAKSRQSTLDSISSSTGESRLFYELVQSLSAQDSVADVAQAISTHLRRCVPVATFVLFVYDQSTDELVARHAFGEHSEALPETRIRMGERITGWAAANRQSVVNSDPVLDLGDVARTHTPRLLSCLAVPLEVSQNLIGVVTLYASQANAFSANHRRIVEMVAGRAAQILQQQLLFEREAGRDKHPVTGVPDGEQLERSFSDQRWLNPDKSLSLLVIPIGALQVDSKVSTNLFDEIRNSVGEEHQVFQSNEGEFVVLMPQTDGLEMKTHVDTIREALATRRIYARAPFGFACGPEDGNALPELLEVARRRLNRHGDWTHDSPESNPAVH